MFSCPEIGSLSPCIRIHTQGIAHAQRWNGKRWSTTVDWGDRRSYHLFSDQIIDHSYIFMVLWMLNELSFENLRGFPSPIIHIIVNLTFIWSYRFQFSNTWFERVNLWCHLLLSREPNIEKNFRNLHLGLLHTLAGKIRPIWEYVDWFSWFSPERQRKQAKITFWCTLHTHWHFFYL